MLRFTSVLVFLLVACAQPSPDAPAADSSNPPVVTPGAPTQPDGGTATIVESVPASGTDATPSETKRPEITIDEVEPGNPVVVRGHARSFENSVSLRLRDSRGALISETFTTSAGEMGQHNPYEARLWVLRDPGASVTVEAFEYSAKDGSIRSLTQRAAKYGAESIPVTLVFPAGDCTKLQGFERSIPKSPAMARLLVEALIAGPTDAEKTRGASSPFPRGSAVNRVALEGGELRVDFNDRLRNVGGSCAATAIRESTVRTLKQLPTVRSVVISAGGSTEQALQP